jgi:pimeloyl-ACP methyl ester carboxylesterase
MPSVEVEGSPIYYDDHGSGDDVLVWLHCFGGSARVWDSIIPRFPEHRSIAIDCRGHGRSAASAVQGGEAGVGFTRLADDVHQVTRSLGISRFIAIGHSLGGGTAIRLAVDQPEVLRAVVCVSGQPAAGSPRLDASDEGLRRYLDGMRDPELQRIAVRAGFLREPAVPGIVDLLVDEGLKVNEHFFLTWLRDGLCYESFEDLLDGITTTTTFIVGGKDLNVPPEAQLSSAKRVPGGRVVQLNDDGHWIFAENPDQFVAEVKFAISLAPKN